jgi:hypothetical protein
MAEEIIGIKIVVNGQEKVLTSMGEIKKELKEANFDVIRFTEQFGATSKEVAEASARVAKLKDAIGDAKAMTDAFNPDAKFKAVTSSLAGVAGGFSAVQGVMALFGKENKNVEAALLKVNAAMALSQGLQAVGESVDSFRQLGAVIKNTSAFQAAYNFIMGEKVAIQELDTATVIADTAATKAQAVATNTATVATTGSTTAMKLFRAAILATGVGALVIGLIAVVNNFDKISNWIAKSPLASLAKGVSNLVTSFTDFVGITSEAERNLTKLSGANKRANEDIENRIKVLKAQGGSEKEIYELSKQRIQNELNDIRNAAKVKGEISTEDQKKMRDLKTEELVLTAGFNKKIQEDTTKANKEKKDAQDKHNVEVKKINDEANKKLEEDTKAANKTLLDLQNDKKLAEITSEEEKAKAKLKIDADAKLEEIDKLTIHEDLKKKLRDAANAAYEAERAELDKKQVAEKAKKDEEEAKVQTEFQTKIADIKIAAIKNDDERDEATRLAKLKKQLTDLDADKEFIKLSEDEKAAVKKDLITASELEAYKAKNEIVKKGLQDELDILQAQQKGIEANSEAYFNNVKEIERVSYELKIAAAKGNAKEIEKINKEHSINNIAIEKAEKEAKKAILLERFKAVENFGKDLQVLAGKNKDLAIAGVIIEKAAAIGQVVVNTVAATSKAVAASPLTLGLPWSALIIAGGVAQTALIIKSGIEQIKQIKAAGASIPSTGSIGDGGGSPDLGSAGGGGSLPDTGGGGGIPPDIASDGGGSRRAPSGGGGGGSVRAYVIQTDINNAQQREQEIQNRARFQ